MDENMQKQKNKYLLLWKRKKYWHKIVGVLACLVVFCTTYALILPAITIEKMAYCGTEEHQHDESCYTTSKKLICGLEEQTEPQAAEGNGEADLSAGKEGEEAEIADGSYAGSHVHTEECYEYEAILTCPLEEHTHTVECYTAKNEETETANAETSEEEPEEEAQQADAEENAEENTGTLEADGETYRVIVVYGDSAGIPEGAVLKVNEYTEDSEEYRTRFAEANAALLDQDGSCVRRARFFNISIMDGENEIEPESTVRVELSQTADLAEGSKEIIITHATDEGTEIISEVEQVQEENGYVTTSFETEAFSDYGTIRAGNSVTIGIDDTVTLEGNNGNKHDWSVSPEGCVTLESDGTKAVITGTAAGTVTVTHQYKNNKSETFTVIVTDTGGSGSGDSDDENDVEKEAPGQGYTVTVKGNKQVLADGIELYVDDYSDLESDYRSYYNVMAADLQTMTSSSISEDSFEFLNMYHIYLSKDGGQTEYDLTADETLKNVNINLQVSITYDTVPAGWNSGNGNLYVGHYKKNGNEIENKGFADASGIKQIKVTGNCITFHVKNFSVFTVASLANASDSSTTIQPGAGGTYGENLAQEAENSWQVASGGYNGNVKNNKTLSDDELVRVQKNVVPTDTENEFLIYLAVDKKVSWEEIIQNAGLLVTTSGQYKKIGETYTSVKGNSSEVSPIPSASAENEYTATVTLTRNGVEVQTITQKYYGTVPNCSNATGFLELTINRVTTYVTASTSVNLHEDGSGSGGALTYTVPLESLESKFDFADFTVGYDGVSDVMGDYIEFDSTFTPTGDYSDAPSYDPDKKTLSWVPVQKSGLLPVYTNDTEKVSGWYLNSTELVYKVKLDVTKAGFESAAEYVTNGGTETDHPYPTNASASLSYHWSGEEADARTTAFTSPEVRGLLYDVIFKKVDADDSLKGVKGAGFTLTDSAGNCLGNLTTTEDQTQYEIASGLPYGAYTLTETLPSGYAAVDETTRTITLCYTDSPTSLTSCETHPGNMRNAQSGTGFLVIENQKQEIEVVLKKTDMSSSGLSGAEFKLYDENKQELEKGLITSGTDGVFTPENFCLEPGTYYLEEIQAPAGYYKPDGMFKLEVTPIQISVFYYDSNAEGNYDGSAAKIFTVQDKKAEVEIFNSTGVELPSTGGTGTLPYTLGGLGLILISCLMYGYNMKRKRERRST